MNTHIFFILNVYFLLLTLSVRKIHPFNSHTKKKKQGINIELCVVAKTRFIWRDCVLSFISNTNLHELYPRYTRSLIIRCLQTYDLVVFYLFEFHAL